MNINYEKRENNFSLVSKFDSTKNNIFKFIWEGNQSFGNICIIRKGFINTITKKEWKRNNKNKK